MPQFVGKTGGFLGSRLKGIGGEILYLVKNRSTLLVSFILEISRLILKVGSFFGDLILEITCLIPEVGGFFGSKFFGIGKFILGRINHFG